MININTSMNNIHQDAQIAEGVSIGNFTTIYDDVVIGKGTKIEPNVVIYPGARIGENCHFFPGCVISAIPQDVKFNGEKTTLEIGNNNIFRECSTLNRGTKASSKTIIGNNNFLLAYSHIGHDCILGNHIILANTAQIGGHVEIDDYSRIGGIVGIQQFSFLGKYAMVVAFSLLKNHLPPFLISDEKGEIETINHIGLQKNGFDKTQRQNIKNIYETIFKSNSIIKAIKNIKERFPPSIELDIILTFYNKCFEQQEMGKHKFRGIATLGKKNKFL